jgi:hypothetical protein
LGLTTQNCATKWVDKPIKGTTPDAYRELLADDYRATLPDLIFRDVADREGGDHRAGSCGHRSNAAASVKLATGPV